MIRKTGLLKVCTGLLLLGVLPAVNAGALRIAITNDDGYDSAGIKALQAAFTGAGHVVTTVGPLTQQSGSSAALNTTPITITRHGERLYSAAISSTEGAEPLVAGMLAIQIATQLDGAPPDWLVSGINQGANLGNATQHSGTVGAAIGALGGSFASRVPAIAVSTDEPKCEQPCIEQHYAAVAGFVSRLLAALKSPLPTGTGLNINYPALPADAIKGVKVVRQGNGFPINGRVLQMALSCAECAELKDGESATAGLAPAPDTAAVLAASDTEAFAAGYITIVPIEGDHTANQFAQIKASLDPMISGVPVAAKP